MSLESLLEATLAGLGYELVDMSMSVKSGLLRVFIDKPNGITLDDCTVVSNHLSNWLVVENIAYERLEISSPGMDRPLRHAADWQRFTGRLASVKSGALGGRVEVTIVGLDGEPGHETLILGDARGEHRVPLAGIEEARLAFHWTR